MTDDGLSDALLFELPNRASAESLSRQLRPEWVAAIGERDGEWRVAALLRPFPGDLARLLRHVEAWAAGRGFAELWFQLDGRSYLLKVGLTPALETHPV